MLERATATEKPCICHKIHLRNCNPKTCPEAAKDSVSLLNPQLFEQFVHLSELNKSADAGCPFCTGLRDGILRPEIKKVWWNVKKSDDVKVMICDYRLNVRIDVGTGSGYDGWFHFFFYRKPGTEAEALGCQSFPISRYLSDHTASETSWSNLRSWLKECEGHEPCMRRSSWVPPKRVLDVGDGNGTVSPSTSTVLR